MPTAEQTRAVVVDSHFPGILRISTVSIQAKSATDVTVRVTAISLNRGEVKRALTAAEDGWRPGWDFTAIVEDAVAEGSGPKIGARVVGMLASGAWAERIRAPSVSLAEIPEGVTEAQAVTLPVAPARRPARCDRKILHGRRRDRSDLRGCARIWSLRLDPRFRRWNDTRHCTDHATHGRNVCDIWCLGGPEQHDRERHVLPPRRRQALWPHPIRRAQARRAGWRGTFRFVAPGPAEAACAADRD